MGDLSKNLSRTEMACQCGCGFDTVDFDLPSLIQDCVNYFKALHPEKDIRVRINSGSRCKKHNAEIGGGMKSQHLYGKAADIVIYDRKSGENIHADKVAEYFEGTYPDSNGIGRYLGRTHIDCRAVKARWDVR